MIRAIVTAVCLASVSAFNAVRSSRASSSLMMADKSKSLPFLPQPANLVGIVGERGFDPLGFTTWIPVKYLQEAEIKHCRVSMLGVAGWIVSEFVKLPGEVHQVSPIAAHDAAVAWGGLQQVLLFSSLFEILSIVAIKEMLEGSPRAPGYFGFDPLGFTKNKSQAEKDKLQIQELENGRTAMLAFSGIVTQAVLTGKDFPYF